MSTTKFSTKFVSEDKRYSSYEHNVPAPLFRKSFVVKEKIKNAEIKICGLGFYDLFINGEKITKGYLAPYISNSDHYTYFDVYDIKSYISEGENVIGIMLGDGFQNGKTDTWDFINNSINSAPMLAIMVSVECQNSMLQYEADDFVCKKGPVIFNDLRSGVFYDARLEEKGWNNKGFEEIGWHTPIKIVMPRGKAKLCEAEPIKVYREIKPRSVKKGEIQPYEQSDQIKKIHTFEAAPAYKGGFIYDFGENNAGIYRLKISGEKGQKISLQFAEQLTNGKLNYSNINFYPDGFCQRDIYYLSGDGEETFEPMFTYHGYRYIYVTGITEKQATGDLLTYLVMSSALEKRGSFECSDKMVNKIYEMCSRSDISNFFYFPTDCPHREKNGWTGDASVSAEHMIMTIGVEKSWKEWLNNIRAAQKENGQLPGIVPICNWGYEWGNGPAWDSVLFNLPYFVYKYRGETDIIEENASAMIRYLDYISKKRDVRGIVEIGLGDWVPVGKEPDNYDADLGFTDSVMVLDMCRKASVMFEAVNLPIQKSFAEKLGQQMLDAIREEYVNKDTLVVKNRCQTSQSMAIFYDVLTDDEKQKGFNVLMDIIKHDNKSFTCGFLGMRVLFHVLSQFGETELAYEMITKKEFPSYGYWVEKDETTLLEQFNKYDEYYPSSKNHHFLGDVLNWFMSSLGGLKVENPSLVRISPFFVKQLDWCKTAYLLPTGKIAIEWKKTDAETELIVNCTDDVQYELTLSEKYSVLKKDNGKYLIKMMNNIN